MDDINKRIQMSRRKGWRKPANTVYVGRGSKWGNPFKLDGTIDKRYVREDMRHLCVDKWQSPEGTRTNKDAVRAYMKALLSGHLTYTQWDVYKELHGKDLACWCSKGETCHADVLLAYAFAALWMPQLGDL